MTKAQLVDSVATATGQTKATAEKTIVAVFNVISEALSSGDKVMIPGFGTFSVADRAARKGKNPRTGEQIDIPASKAPKFKPGQTLKDIVAK